MIHKKIHGFQNRLYQRIICELKSQFHVSPLQLNNFHNASVDELPSNIKPFSTIPGPQNVPIFGSILPYMIGAKKIKDYHLDIVQLHKNYGPIVKENFGGQIIIHIFDPDDIQTVYEADGKIPFIPPLQETTQLYRQSKDMSPGLGNVNGDEWYKLRHAVQQMMLRPKEVSHYLPLQENVAKLAVDNLPRFLDSNGAATNINDWVAKWILESAGTICFETSLGSFSNDERESLALKLIEANRRMFQLTSDLKFSLRLYRFFKSPKYKKLLQDEDFFYGISTNFINSTMKVIQELIENNSLREDQYSFLSYLMGRKDLSDKDVVTITFSLFSDGLSTTVPTILGNLHCLALCPEIQEKLYDEIISQNGENDITPQSLNKMSYLKAFVKEVFRFYPIGETVQRLTQKDLVLQQYLIPSGSYIDLNPYVWLRDENIFYDANSIVPERWLRHKLKAKEKNSKIHPYILNPFSVGTRMCAGRRFAEQDLYVGLSQVIRRYKIIATNKSSPTQEWRTLLYPKLPLPIKFIPRN